jgi:hypothetical protein
MDAVQHKQLITNRVPVNQSIFLRHASLKAPLSQHRTQHSTLQSQQPVQGWLISVVHDPPTKVQMLVVRRWDNNG